VQQVLHTERVVLVVLQEEIYLVEVVLGTVGGTVARYTCIEKPFGVLSEQGVHGA